MMEMNMETFYTCSGRSPSTSTEKHRQQQQQQQKWQQRKMKRRKKLSKNKCCCCCSTIMLPKHQTSTSTSSSLWMPWAQSSSSSSLLNRLIINKIVTILMFILTSCCSNKTTMFSTPKHQSIKLFYIIIIILIIILTILTTNVVDGGLFILKNPTTIMATILSSSSTKNGQYLSRNKFHQQKLFVGTSAESSSSQFSELQMDQPSSQSSSASQSASSTVIVISGQRTKLLCPLIDQTKLLTNKKLLPSSAANSVVVVHHQDGTSSTAATIIPIKWQKENSILPYDHRQHIQPNGTLIIQSSQKRLDEGSYYCYFDENFSTSTVTDNNGKKSNNNNINAQNKDFIMKNGAATVHLKVMDPPHVAPFEFPADLQIGMKARAMCSVMRGDQPFRFYWTQDGHRLESDLPTEDTGAIYRLQHFRDYSMLTVDSLTLAHAGNITCTVSNDAARTSQSSLLKVNAPPQWLIEPKDTQVILHQSVRIDCLASGSPKPFTTWKRAIGTSPWEYIPIYNSIHYYLHSNGSLQIKSATHQQSGQYICQSTNGYGTDIGKLIHLKINEPPRFQITIQQKSAHKDRPVRLICPPEGDHPIHMEWFQLINDTNRNLESLDSSSTTKRDNHGNNNNRAKISLNANDNFNDKYLFEIKEISRKFLLDERRNNNNNNDNDNINDDDDDDELNDNNDNDVGVMNSELDIVDRLTESTSKSSTINQQKSKNLIVSILTIRKPTRLDSSLYLCKASNEYGWAEMKIRLIVKEKPDVPEKFSIQNVTESRTEIRWHESFNGNSNIVNYVVQYRLITNPSTTTRNDNQISSSSTSTTDSSINVLDMDDDDDDDGDDRITETKIPKTTTKIQTINIPMEKIIISNGSSSSSIRQTMINNLRSNSLYKIRLAAINRLGQSDYTKWLRFRTEQSAPETPPIDIQATPTGPNSIKITWKAPKKSEWNGEISGYYIGYRSEKSDTDLYKTVENIQVNGRYESHITNLQRSTIYKSWVQAFNQRGTGPRSEIVSVQTLADVPPSAPLLRLHSSTSDSITISWLSATYGGSGGSGGQLSSRKASSSSSSNDLTLYYRLYQPLSSSSSSVVTNNNNIGQSSSMLMPNNWHDISILEPNGRHTITGLECGRSYEFFATAHNSVGKSEPSTPLIARTRGEAPTPPGRNNLLSETISDNSKTVTIIINLINWKNNECPINHFTLRIRPLSLQKSSALQQQQQQQHSSSSTLSATNVMSNTGWTILSMQHNPRENFLLRKLIPNQPYELEITAHSSAGSTQVIHQFLTPNITTNIDSSSSSFLNKIGYDNSNTKLTSSISYPMPSSTTTEISFGDYEILLPIISSMIVVIVIIAVACFLCSRDHHSLFLQPIGNGHNGHNNDGHLHHHHQRQPSTPSSENKVPFHHSHHQHPHHHSNDPNDLQQQQQEMSILKELVRSNSITIMDGFNPLINNGGGGIGQCQSTDSSTILTTTNGIIGNGGDYGDLQNRLIDSEPTSLINTNNNQQQQQLRNHSYHHPHLHHHQLTLMSPRHQQQGKTIAMGKDLVELQSFLNNSTNNNNNSNGYVTQKRIGHSGNGGNYALPYDVLPVVTQSKQQQSGNNMAIYGQRTTFISANNNNNNEPLYATAKLININGNGGGGGQFVNYGQKIDELAMSTVIANSASLSSSSTSSSTTNGSQRTNYESLVPIICSSSSTSTSTSSSGMAISTASAVTAGTNTMVM